MSYLNPSINPSPTILLEADTALSQPAMLAVALNSSGKATLPSAGAHAIGIALPDTNDDIASGGDITVLIKDCGLWIAGAAVAKGAELATNAEGKAVTAAAGDFVLATALDSAAGAGAIIPVQIIKAGYKPATA